MTERVRVTGPPRHDAAGRPLSRLGDVHEQTALGDVYLRSLLRERAWARPRRPGRPGSHARRAAAGLPPVAGAGGGGRARRTAGLAAAGRRRLSLSRAAGLALRAQRRAQRTRLRRSRRGQGGGTGVSTDAVPGLVAVLAVTVATVAIGTWGLRFSRTTSDFFVASRTVRPRLNASAIGGEYLSAASFLGVAGLLLVGGADMLWYPVGWTAGYLVLLVLVAAPLRRSGAYTLPDFAEARLASRWVRSACSLLVVGVGWLYLVPQFKGAGITLESAIGAPVWAGPVIVGLVVLVNVMSGGMRSITFVQAFQYWLKPDRDPLPRDGPGRRVVGRGTARRAGRRRRVVRPGRRRRGDRAVLDVLADHRALPRHDGPAARGRALLHEPGRSRRTPYDARGARPARALLRLAAGVRRPRPGLRRPAGPRGPLRRARAGVCPG
ncbi:hypothetical protein [Nocardioides convexus]|uniref:sodium:solute symporter family transporter n=1 Tax=Nocardioides convexus TaxID=2712224 RepID=UPI00241874CE|nr:hypothetical protein [Nocardioides convexus]